MAADLCGHHLRHPLVFPLELFTPPELITLGGGQPTNTWAAPGLAKLQRSIHLELTALVLLPVSSFHHIYIIADPFLESQLPTSTYLLRFPLSLIFIRASTHNRNSRSASPVLSSCDTPALSSWLESRRSVLAQLPIKSALPSVDHPHSAPVLSPSLITAPSRPPLHHSGQLSLIKAILFPREQTLVYSRSHTLCQPCAT